MIKDRGYLNILSFINFIYAGIIFSIFLLEYNFSGIFSKISYGDILAYKLFVFAKELGAGILDFTPNILFILELFLWLFVSIFSMISGFLLKKQKNYWFSFSLAIMQCFLITISKSFLKNLSVVLGVITIIILLQQPIKNLYIANLNLKTFK